jgi:hypothetical protein
MQFMSDSKNVSHKEEVPCDDEVQLFWEKSVNWQSELMELDDAPLSIPENIPLAKVHFMFMMLGLSQLYVLRKGVLVGYITRDSFSHKHPR